MWFCFAKGNSDDGGLSSSILFKYECRVGHFFVFSWLGYDVSLCGVLLVEWYGVCDFVVFSVVEICVDYDGVHVFHVCFYLCIVYGVGVCVDVFGVICVIEWSLFLPSGCWLL